MEALSVASVADFVTVILSASRQILRDISSIMFFTQHYGPTGLVLCLFGNSEVWKVQVQVLQSTNEADILNFKKTAQNECSIIDIASTIVAQIAITALSLEGLSRMHWSVRGLFALSLVSSLIAVYYATKQYSRLGRYSKAGQVKAWIGYETLAGEIRPAHPIYNIESIETRKRRENMPSVSSVLTMAAPDMLLSFSLHSVLLGLGFYFGQVWTHNLDEAAGAQGSRAVFITYMVGLGFCYYVYSLSDVVMADQNYVSEASLIENEDGVRVRTRPTRRDEDHAASGIHATVHHAPSGENMASMAVDQSVSPDAFRETCQEQSGQDSAAQSRSIARELTQVFREAARLRKESMKIEERLAQLLEVLGRDSGE